MSLVPLNRVYSLYDFCSLVGKTRKTVGDWIKLNNAPCKFVDGQYHIDVAEMWEWHTKHYREKVEEKYKNVDVDDVKLRKERAIADTKEFELEIMKQNYLKRDLVEKMAFQKGKAVKDSLMAVPDRLCGMLVGCTDERSVHKILSEEIFSILSSLSIQEISLEEEQDDSDE
jgi:hypothetical protein